MFSGILLKDVSRKKAPAVRKGEAIDEKHNKKESSREPTHNLENLKYHAGLLSHFVNSLVLIVFT
jgi:hypothetical protein